METILQARDLAKSFHSGDGNIEVLRKVDLDICMGETVSVRGESGSGKTTLLNIIAGLEKMDSGKVIWGGRDIQKMSSASLAEKRARWIGMVFQAYYLIPEFNALENVVMAARILGKSRKGARVRAGQLLKRVGLEKRLKSAPSHLSGGERQRVALARALMNKPVLILADEPTGNLDEKTGCGVMDLLLKICREEKNTSLVLVTHNPEFAACTDRQLYLHNGTIDEVDTQ